MDKESLLVSITKKGTTPSSDGMEWTSETVIVDQVAGTVADPEVLLTLTEPEQSTTSSGNVSTVTQM